MQCDRSSTNTEAGDPISPTVIWKSWSGKLWFNIQYTVNEDLACMTDVRLGRTGAVAESFLRRVFIQSLFLQEMKQHSSSPRLFQCIGEEVKGTASKCQAILY